MILIYIHTINNNSLKVLKYSNKDGSKLFKHRYILYNLFRNDVVLF